VSDHNLKRIVWTGIIIYFVATLLGVMCKLTGVCAYISKLLGVL